MKNQSEEVIYNIQTGMYDLIELIGMLHIDITLKHRYEAELNDMFDDIRENTLDLIPTDWA